MGHQIIGYRIEQRRKQLGMTLDDIAQELGVAKSTIQRYEKGTIDRVKLPIIEAIARVLSVNPAWICGKTDNMEPEKKSSVADNRDNLQNLVNGDQEFTEFLEQLRNRSEMRMLFSVSKNASKEDVEKAVAIIEALRGVEGRN